MARETVTAAEITIAEKVRQYRELGESIKATEERRRLLAEQIEEWMGEDDELDIEGLPLLRRITRSAGEHWDSDAIRNIIERHPHEWRKLIELGCVEINAKAVKDAISHNQLAGKPMGSIERRSKPFLQFDRK